MDEDIVELHRGREERLSWLSRVTRPCCILGGGMVSMCDAVAVHSPLRNIEVLGTRGPRRGCQLWLR